MAEAEKQSTHTSELMTRIIALKESDKRKTLRTRSRREKIQPEYVGHTLAIFNGMGFAKVHITSEMVGRPLGKVAPHDTPTARAKYLSIPPRKMRLVADLVTGLPVEEALNILNFTPRIAAHHLALTLKSAVANKLSIEGTDHLHPEDLRVRLIIVEAGPIAKRVRFQSMGRVFRIRKRYCHLSIYLEEGPHVEKASVETTKSGAGKAAEAKPAKAKATKKKVKSKTPRSKVNDKGAKTASGGKKVTKKTGVSTKKI